MAITTYFLMIGIGLLIIFNLNFERYWMVFQINIVFKIRLMNPGNSKKKSYLLWSCISRDN